MLVNPWDIAAKWMAFILNLTFSTTIRAINSYGRRRDARATVANQPGTSNAPKTIQEPPSGPGSKEPIALKIRLRVPHMVEPHMVLPKGTILMGDLYPNNRLVIRGTQDVTLDSMEWDAIFDDLEAYNHFARWGQDRLDA